MRAGMRNRKFPWSGLTLRPHALVLTTDRDIIHVMCKSAANFLLLFMSHLLLAWVMNVPEQPFSYNSKELANMR